MASAADRIRGVWAAFLGARWGELCVAPLLVSVASGALLALKYDPAAPYASVVAIELLVPFGSLLRGLHYYASQLFFIFFVFHLFTVLARMSGRDGCCPPGFSDSRGGCDRGQWLKLVFALPVTTMLLFTGYVLKMDATGAAAGAVAENIVLSVPFVGGILNRMLFAISETGLRVVYANHLAGLFILWTVLLWDHLRRYRFSPAGDAGVVAALFAVSLALPAPLTPKWPGVAHLDGPWFLIGLQELLRHVQPFWAGIVFPSLPVAALAAVSGQARRCRLLMALILLWLALYAGLTVAGLCR